MFIEDQNDETRLVVKIDSAMGPVQLKVKMTPDYPHSVPELSVSGTSHRLVVGDAIKALEKEVINTFFIDVLFLCRLGDWWVWP